LPVFDLSRGYFATSDYFFGRGTMEEIGTATVWSGGKNVWTLYKEGSAERHSGADNEELRSQLQKALNMSDTNPNKIFQGKDVYKVKINEGIGYLVYKVKVRGDYSACIFHYHWNYYLDIPITDI
jgi:hypothetical protein